MGLRPASAQNATVGLYTDPSGSTCNFTGDAPGVVTAYVVVRPGAPGVTGVQFSAPLPACFGATYMGESVPPNALVIGNSQTGVSIALLSCALQPVSVMQITYQQIGGTTPCCPYPILPDPTLTEVVATDCSFQPTPIGTMTARLNSDGTCPCTGNSAPDTPSNPVPTDGALAQSRTPLLSWYAADADGNLAEFDLYLGTTSPPALVAAGLTQPYYRPPGLDALTQYYWRVVARDGLGLESSGPTWTFTTRATNYPPFAPTPVFPTDLAWGVQLNTDLAWSASDLDADVLVYDVYFGTSSTPPLVASDLLVPSYDPGQLNYSTHYYWRVVVSDGTDETSGPVWTFETRGSNTPPSAPTNEQPPNTLTGVSVMPVLSWQADDPDGDPLVYRIHFGTTNPPPPAAQGLTQPTYMPGTLMANTTYYWRVWVSDGQFETPGPGWSFTTGGVNSPPTAPANPAPPHNQTNVALNPVLSWTSSDPDGDLLVYRVHFGTSTPPPLVAQGLTQTLYGPGTLTGSTTYYWRVVVSDGASEVIGPVWSFRTGTGDIPPGQPSVGLYANPTGSLCSFTGDGPGIVTAHVILRPGAVGATGVQFAAPVPGCFGAVHLSDVAPAGMLTLGTSQTGVSVAIGSCVNEPVKVLEITYFRSGGATAPCCPYPIVADPHVGSIVVADCTYELYDVPGATSFFNANESCPCGVEPSPPSIPTNPQPADQAVGVSFTPTLSWFASDVDGDLEEFDVYFGTTPTPPLVAAGLFPMEYTPAPLDPFTQYYWRVVARDAGDLETSGPVWTFTTRVTNQPPLPPSDESPHDGQVSVPLTASLSWTGTDPEGDPLTYDVYFGTAANPPLIASDLTNSSFSPGALQIETQYYWRVVAKDGTDETSGSTWMFRTLFVGDVIPDGQLTVADAECALRLGLFDFSCGGSGASDRADVDCSNRVTPRDARCIHKKVVDGSCTFCGGGTAAPENAVVQPVLWATNTFRDGDELVSRLFLSGVASLEAFGFYVRHDANIAFSRALRYDVTAGFEGFHWTPSPLPPFIPAAVGGYTLGGVPADIGVAFVELRFVVTSGEYGYAYVEGGFDDLGGANQVVILVDDGNPTPVLISRFEAVRSGSDVEVRWDFSSDEPVDTYTLYRRDESAALPVAIAEGPADATRSYVDRTVAPGTTYRYELLVRTRGGDEFRSETATVTTAELSLALRQNHPNPFNPQTTIPFDVPGAGTSRVRLLVMDAAGRLVRTLVDEAMPGGSHAVVWNGRDQRGGAVSSGVYFYVLDVGGERRTRKMVLLK
ncbi:MAG TPA: FlgD immunoglobulin-like domain containing protein [Candidatus Krumholzibacteria bacterium]|nr:FlgD immunoglobulin-like domain containing protein [Candidatus Krumholzibacteria bacterium]